MMNRNYLDFEKPIFELYNKIEELKKLSGSKKNMDEDIKKIKDKAEQLRDKIFTHLEPYQIVQIARHPDRPLTSDYLENVFTDFIELHGDRLYGDDKALIGGFAKLDNRPVMVIGHQKGKDTKQNIYRNFGMPHPEGYRKALRLMKLAEKFSLPVVALVDVQGAYPGLGSEERGVAEAIAKNLQEMMGLKVPIIVIITGEGGSGGALGVAIGNKVAMLTYSVYSVISPEGCAAILWRDSSMASVAAENLGITAPKLLEIGVIDEIIEEPQTGAHSDPQKVYKKVKVFLKKELKRYSQYPLDKLLEERYQKFRVLGKFTEA
ncbi:MAG: acetyl-CoA carboxylase carboxyltransferase subunit alpha [Candidatus Margulisbacteria bacterium]|nr:acetyl-CoA carboxylase carboxyltransferase subunit alpha [Candidatus Margulisiibacteriota bacterium]